MCIRDRVIAGLFFHDGTHLIAQSQHICTGRSTQIDHKAAVLVTDGCAAMAVAPQTALVDEGRRKCAHRPLEGAAGTDVYKRQVFGMDVEMNEVSPLTVSFGHIAHAPASSVSVCSSSR